MREEPLEAGAETTGGSGGGQTDRPTEARNPSTLRIDRAATPEIVRLLLAEEAGVSAAVERERDAIARLVDEVADRLRQGGRLLYVGAGTSGRLGALDAAECPPTFGTDPRAVGAIVAGGAEAMLRSREGAEDDVAGAREAIRAAGVGPRDFVLGIAASGTTPFVRAALAEAKTRGAGTGLVSCAPPPPEVRALADRLVTPIVGPEAIAGSTRLKAGTATKLVLNALTTGAMIRLGKVHENLMVDLHAASVKLVERSLRMLREVCGLEREAARRLLVASGGSVKTAIAMRELGLGRDLAERALDARDGFLRAAIEAFRGGPPPGGYGFYPEDGSAEERAAALRRLAGAPARLRDAIGEAERRPAAPAGEPDGARGTRGRDGALPAGRWSPARHLAHLIEFETEAVRPRLRAFAAGEPGALEEWEGSPRPPLGGRGAPELLERFAGERRETLAAAGALDGAAWSRRARLGDETLTPYRLLRGVAQHDDAHAARIRERLHPALLRPPGGPGEAA